MTEDQAIERLTSISIRPVLQSDPKWEKDTEASEKFVAEIQASIQVMLKNVATSLGIAPPPTLELFIFEVPPTAQHVYFSDDMPTPGLSPTADTPPTGPAFPYEPGVEPGSPHDGRVYTSGGPPRLPVKPRELESTTADVSLPDVKESYPDVLAQLSGGEAVPVVVILAKPTQLPPAFDAMELVNEVLEELADEEFRVKRIHDSIPGFSGSLLSPSGLEKLTRDPRVLRIQIDQLDAPQ
jgi:hypothetical protein